jgi:hypothetical protein
MQAMKAFNQFLEELGDDDATDDFQLQHTAPDDVAVVTDLQTKIGFSLPSELRDLYLKEGAIRTNEFGDVWQTLSLYSANSMLKKPCGLCAHIDWVWGGRPELSDEFTAIQIKQLDADYIVFGSRYEDDNVHDYFFFDRLGRIDNLRLDQDDMTHAFEKLASLLAGSSRNLSLEELLSEQLTLMREVIEEDYS